MRKPFLRVLLFVTACLSTISAMAQPVADFTINYPSSDCAPVIISFTNSSTGKGALIYAWNFGINGGINSTLRNPGVTYADCGVYNVSLTVTDNTGQSTTVIKQVTVKCSPHPNFTVSATQGCVPLAVQFTNTSTAGSDSITQYLWDFGDGNVGYTKDPFHTYYTAGCKTVTLIVTNAAGCTKDTTFKNLICPTGGIVANFNSSTTSACNPPLKVNFFDLTTGGSKPYHYSWYFPGGTPATSNVGNPIVNYTAGGSYDVILIVTDVAGCSDTITKKQYINISTSSVNFFISDTDACAPATIHVDASNLQAKAYSWTTTGGNPSASTDSAFDVSYLKSGSYQICLTATLSGCVVSGCRTITVNDPPVANFSVKAVGPICSPPLSVNFINKSIGATSYQWTFPGGSPTTSTATDPVNIIYNNCGSYPVILVATKNGCSDTLIMNNAVNIDCPQASFFPSVSGGCSPLAVIFNSTKSSGNPVKWFWNFGDTPNPNLIESKLQNPAFTFIKPGCYTVRLIIQNAGGCQDTLVMASNVCVGAKPNPDFYAFPTSTCASTSISFHNKSTNVNDSTSYEWSFYGSAPFKINSVDSAPVYNYQDTGWFDVTLVACNNGCCDTITFKHYMHILAPIAKTRITYDCANPSNVTLDGTPSIGADTYSWLMPGAMPATSSAPVVTATYPASGNYQISLTVFNIKTGCSYTKKDSIHIRHLKAAFTILNGSGCLPYKFCVTNQSVDAVKSYWSVINSLGQTIQMNSVDANPCFTINQPGAFTVQLVVKDMNGCVNTVIQAGTVNIFGIKVSFTAVPTTGCSPLTVAFQDKSSSPNTVPISWKWNFGDAGSGASDSSSLQNPSHTYNNTGSYSVTLTITDDHGCVNSSTRGNLIQVTKPQVNFVADQLMACPQSPVCFKNSTAGLGCTYNWSFGDKAHSTANNPCHPYMKVGNYTVELVATDLNGCKDSLAQKITVSQPKASFTADNTSTTCPPLIVHFTNSSMGTDSNSTYLWDFGDNSSSTVADPSHIYNQIGQYDVTLIVNSGYGCSDTLHIPKYINVGGPVAIITSVQQPGCFPLTVCFFAKGTNIKTYTWDFGDGTVQSTGAVDSICYTYSIHGIYFPRIILQDSGGCISDEEFDSVIVAQTTAYFKIDNSNFCQSGTVNFTDSSTARYSLTKRLWDFGDPASGKLDTTSQVNPSHFYSVPGTYVVTLTLDSKTGCTDTSQKYIYVHTLPSPNVGPPQNVCIGSNIQLNASGGVKYNWTPGNDLSDSTISNPFANPKTSTTYYVTIIDVNGCTGKDSILITVKLLPVINAGPDVAICAGTSTTITVNPSGLNYTWTPNTGIVSVSGNKFSVAPASTTNYIITGIDSFGCSSTDSVLINVLTIPVIIAGPDVSICLGQTATIEASGGLSYNWFIAGNANKFSSQDTVQISPSQSTSYVVIGTGANGCAASDTENINVNPLPVLQASAASAICKGTSVQLNVSGAQTYSWSPSNFLSDSTSANPMASPPDSTLYFVTGKDANGCINKDSVWVDVIQPPVAAVGPGAAICLGGQVQLTASGGTSYQWSPALGLDNPFSADPVASPDTTTTYQVIVSDGVCFDDTGYVTVTINPLSFCTAGAGAQISAGTPVQLHGNGNGNLQWSPPDYLSCTTCPDPIANPPHTITYYLESTTPDGCDALDSLRIIVMCEDASIFVPNAFTPNGDGQHDIFKVTSIGISSLDYLRIYDRWGELVFQSNSLENGWNGMYNGQPASTGVYVYYLRAFCSNGSPITKQGNITLLR